MTAGRVVLRGGIVVDGLGGEPRRADVEVRDGRIGAVGDVSPHAGDEVLDCTDRMILPGFIDAHAHADGAVFDPDVQLALLRQGITSVIGGQDGVSYAPGDGAWAGEYFAAINGPHPTFRGGRVADLLATYDGASPLNVGYLVPAGTVRHQVMGMRASSPDEGELEAMRTLVAEGLDDGALGLSTGLDYVPGIFASTAELAALCEPVAAVDALYVTHMRGGYESATAGGLAEVAEICRRSGVRAHVSHLHVDADDAARLLAETASAGVSLTFDMYPYTRGCTLLSMAVLPPEYSALAVDDAIARLSDDVERERLVRDWFPLVAERPSLGPAWPDMIRVGHTPAADWAWAHGRTLAEIAATRGTAVDRATLDLLVASRLEVNAVMAVRDERPVENLARLFTHPGHTGGSDGIFIGAAPHPRAYGAFARFLGTYVGPWYSWPDAAVHLSARTADRFGLAGRGDIRTGAIADVIVIDPDAATDRATYDEPCALAVGIDDVFVAGTAVLRGGALTGAHPGRALRRGTRHPSP